MRNVVDEKLSSTLNERLAQSFKVIGIAGQGKQGL